MNVSEALVREIVERVISSTGISGTSFQKEVDKSGVLVVKTDTVTPQPFEYGERVYVTDVVSLEESPRMGCGVMELDHTDFEWTLTYDEFDYVIDGTLEVVTDGNIITGNKGDIVYIPKGSHIHFRSPNKARFVYFVYPADWQNQTQ
ncbi:MAG: cupin domain-containing protein [Oscillospiraceae bacterium]